MIYDYNGIRPAVSDGVFIAPSASVVGDVSIGRNSSIWFNTVIRADNAPVRIGKATSIQDNACIHDKTTVGDNVTIGHGAIVHGCMVGDNALIGMGAVVLDGAIIGEGAIVAAGSVVRMGTVIPPRSLFAGNPAVWKKDLPESSEQNNLEHAVYYGRLGLEYRQALGEARHYADD